MIKGERRQAERRHVETVPEALAGERIDRLVAMAADVSRREASDLIDGGRVLVNGVAPTKASERVATDDVVEIVVPEGPSGPTAEPEVVLDIIYSDEDVVVVDKQPHLVVHPGSGVAGGTLVNGLLALYPDIVGVGELDRPGIVHRLDKGTSGLLMVALNEAARGSLSGQLADRSVTRRYLTLVAGSVDAETGIVDAPIGRSVRQPTLRAVMADGKPARTHYRVLQRFDDADTDAAWTMVECRLETGRTHQIRVHMAAIGHPVVGDHRYGAPTEAFGLDRPFLHAAELGFTHPRTGRRLEFSSEPPADLAGVLRRLDGPGGE